MDELSDAYTCLIYSQLQHIENLKLSLEEINSISLVITENISLSICIIVKKEEFWHINVRYHHPIIVKIEDISDPDYDPTDTIDLIKQSILRARDMHMSI